jgi:DNA-binding NtrC family response regulator
MYADPREFAASCEIAISASSALPPADGARGSAHARLQSLGALYGACEPMQRLFQTIRRLGPSGATVMILGESGSGKELVAQAIHGLSERTRKAFVAINCGAIPENLIESELFGHERGSFTGAARTHRGCFERADGGTLFLDEITEMPIDMQVRLLRVLETGRFCRVGGDEEISVAVRVIAASNRDLGQAVAEGKLRSDLMYRLCVIPVTVPPLRDRGDDTLLLAEMFLGELNDLHGTEKVFGAMARARVEAHSWPGNVRELKNAVHRAYVLSDEVVEFDVVGLISEWSAKHLSSSPSRASHTLATAVFSSAPGAAAGDITIRVGTSLDDAERALIMATLASVEGSKSRAAQILGISLKTLYNRLHAYRRMPNHEGSADTGLGAAAAFVA